MEGGIEIFLFKPLFNQENPIEITNLFFKGVLAKTAAQITTIQYISDNFITIS